MRRLMWRGVLWEVFAVRLETAALPADEPPNGVERRSERRLTVREQLRRGWLCFESTLGKRRLVPIPDEWETVSDDELSALAERAEPVPALPSAALDRQPDPQEHSGGA